MKTFETIFLLIAFTSIVLATSTESAKPCTVFSYFPDYVFCTQTNHPTVIFDSGKYEQHEHLHGKDSINILIHAPKDSDPSIFKHDSGHFFGTNFSFGIPLLTSIILCKTKAANAVHKSPYIQKRYKSEYRRQLKLILESLAAGNNLTSLTIRNVLANDEFVGLFAAILANSPFLQDLSIENWKLLTSKNVELISTKIAALTSLQSFKIAKTVHFNDYSKIINAIFSPSMSNLKTLDVNIDTTRDSVFIELCDNLMSNTSIDTLIITQNHDGDEGIKRLIQTLAKNVHIKHLYLECKVSYSMVIKEFADALKANGYLENVTLKLSVNYLEGEDIMTAALTNHPTIKKWNIEDCFFGTLNNF